MKEIEWDGDRQRQRWSDRERRSDKQIETKLYAITGDIFVLKSKFITSVELSPKRYVINNVRPTCVFIFSVRPRFDTRKILIHSNPQVIWVNKAIDYEDDDDDDDEKREELIMYGGFGKLLPARASLSHCLVVIVVVLVVFLPQTPRGRRSIFFFHKEFVYGMKKIISDGNKPIRLTIILWNNYRLNVI